MKYTDFIIKTLKLILIKNGRYNNLQLERAYICGNEYLNLRINNAKDLICAVNVEEDRYIIDVLHGTNISNSELMELSDYELYILKEELTNVVNGTHKEYFLQEYISSLRNDFEEIFCFDIYDIRKLITILEDEAEKELNIDELKDTVFEMLFYGTY